MVDSIELREGGRGLTLSFKELIDQAECLTSLQVAISVFVVSLEELVNQLFQDVGNLDLLIEEFLYESRHLSFDDDAVSVVVKLIEPLVESLDSWWPLAVAAEDVFEH